jgi:lipopolysaccharide biosynthesis protein
MALLDVFRAWRRDLKARLPYVRRREYRILQRRHGELVEGLGWHARPATEAKIFAVKPVLDNLVECDVCFFVSFNNKRTLKNHVVIHIRHLLSSGIRVVLVLNTDLSLDEMVIDPELLGQLSGFYVRENVGFDFAAWAHLYCLLVEKVPKWSRLFLINDSIVGPLNSINFDLLIQRIYQSDADVVGLTECAMPLQHVQSFFLVFNKPALTHPFLNIIFSRILSLSTKDQVIDVYETRLTQMLIKQGLSVKSIFSPLSNDPYSSNDTSFRWNELILAGFPYIKTSVIDKFANSATLKDIVPLEFRNLSK